jgi:hypothetical protein
MSRATSASKEVVTQVTDGPGPSADQEFLEAIEQYRRQHRRPFPTWCEVLEVARTLGYAKDNSMS